MRKRFTSKLSDAPPRNSKVISVGANPELLALREAVLQKAGLEVISTDDASRALSEFQSGSCDVVVLCHSLTDTVLEQLGREFRESCPEGRIVIITNEELRFSIAENTKVVYGIDGPETLVEAIRAA